MRRAMSGLRSEEHTSELQSRGLISYAVFCLKNKDVRLSQEFGFDGSRVSTYVASSQRLAEGPCARCHEVVLLSQEFGFEGSLFFLYLASHHRLPSPPPSTVLAN